MKMRKGVLIFLSSLLIVLELLPYGAVLNFVDIDGEAIRKTYSYFSLMPFGNANFTPLVIAVLSLVLLVLTIIYALKNKALRAVQVISLVIVILSFFPIIIMGTSYLSVVGIAIAVIAFAQAVWSFVIEQDRK